MAGTESRRAQWEGRKTEGDKLRQAIRECWLRLPQIALFGLFINVLFLASPLYLMQIFDRVLGSGHIETLIALTIIVAVALLAMGVLEFDSHDDAESSGTVD